MNRRRDYIYNAIAGMINACEAVVMMMIVTRVSGLNEAGYLTIAFAVGNLLMSVGKWGMYNYQISDNNGEFDNRSYLYARLATVVLMLVCLTVYLLYGRFVRFYSFEKTVIILMINLIYAAETLEDLMICFYQRCGQLWRGSLAFITRWAGIMVSFGIAEALFHNTAAAITVSFAVSIAVFSFNVCCFRKKMQPGFWTDNSGDSPVEEDQVYLSRTAGLIRVTFPLFLSSFLTFYISNASKYALEKYTDPTTLACYGFVSMPVFAISLINGFIYRPQLVSLSQDYSSGRLTAFKKRIRKQILIILAITATCIAGAWLIGIPVLSWLYHTPLDEYLGELMIIVSAGGFLALSGYQSVILTIIRRQKLILYGYIMVALAALVSTWFVVRLYGTMGGALSYLMLMILLVLFYSFCIIRELRGAE